jgi:hypothetical protein
MNWKNVKSLIGMFLVGALTAFGIAATALWCAGYL